MKKDVEKDQWLVEVGTIVSHLYLPSSRQENKKTLHYDLVLSGKGLLFADF